MCGWCKKIMRLWRQRAKILGLKKFEEYQQQEEAFECRERGVLTVPLDRIVGSVGRYQDFDGKFKPKSHIPPERLKRIKTAMRSGKPLPPVKLYQIKNEYYVLDGNHRIAAANELGRKFISGKIVEFTPSRNTLENILYREKTKFHEDTQIPDTIELTEIGQYEYLHRQIETHRKYLENTGQSGLTFEKAAEDWCQTIYSPLKKIIQKAGLIESFPGRTVDDLYTYVSAHQWDKQRKRQYGEEVDQMIPEDMEAFRKNMAEKQEFEYPEMKREITAFIMMNVSAKKEFRLIEKLYSLKEVREIHSVHGNVDIIVKVVLTRDLLSSDAEVISYFVHNQVRQIPGILNTQTLIPGYSRIKNPDE